MPGRQQDRLPRSLADPRIWLLCCFVSLPSIRTFYKHLGTPEGIRTLLEGCDRDNDGVVSMHLWAHLWWSPKRRDFSDFHAGLMTEQYIRTIDTTYNLAARPYLPGGK